MALLNIHDVTGISLAVKQYDTFRTIDLTIKGKDQFVVYLFTHYDVEDLLNKLQVDLDSVRAEVADAKADAKVLDEITLRKAERRRELDPDRLREDAMDRRREDA